MWRTQRIVSYLPRRRRGANPWIFWRAGCCLRHYHPLGAGLRRIKMKARTLALAVSALTSVAVIPGASDAGILRDVMVSVGLSKPPPPKPGDASTGLPRKGFACCNLHYSKDWINDGNYAELPMIPAGTPMEVLSYGRHRAYVTVDGKPMRLGHDYGRDQETLEVWVAKIVVTDDPRPHIASWSKAVQDAIQQGKVMVGMTKEQAIVSVGYPLTSENVSLDAPMWKIWRSSHGEYDLNFKPDGRLGSITGEDEVTNQVVYRPGK